MVGRFVSRFPWRLARAICIVLAIVGMSAVGVFGAITNMAAPRVIAPGAPLPAIVATPTAPAPIAESPKVPCKQQSWPMIDRSCASWTADARKVEAPAPEPARPAPQQQAAPAAPLPAAAPQPIKVAAPAEQSKKTAVVVEPPKVDPPKIDPPRIDPPKPAPVATAAPKAEQPKIEPAKVEPAKIEPAKIESAGAELPTAAPTEVETAQAVPVPRPPRTGPRSKPETSRTQAAAETGAPKDTTRTEPKLKLADNAASTSPALVAARQRRSTVPTNTVPANAVPAPFPIREFLATRR